MLYVYHCDEKPLTEVLLPEEKYIHFWDRSVGYVCNITDQYVLINTRKKFKVQMNQSCLTIVIPVLNSTVMRHNIMCRK